MAGNDHHKKNAFVAALAECGTIRGASRAADVSRTSHYRWLSEDADYAAKVAEAMDEAGDALEEEARNRALAGSDTMLIFLLKGAKPEKFGDKSRVKLDADVTQRAEVHLYLPDNGRDEN